MTAADASRQHVLCMGDVMVDVVARLSGPLETGSDRSARTELHGGGSAANTASWLAHLNVPTTLLGRVGTDILGVWSRELLGPDLSRALAVDPARATGTCIVLVSPDGERTMAPDTGANAAMRPGHIDRSQFIAGRHLHVSGYAIFGGAREAALHAMSLARAAHMTLSVGAASSAPLAELGADAFLDLIGSDLLLFANHDEARILTGHEDPDVAAQQLSRRVGRAVVTRGSSGAIWSGDGLSVDEPTPPADTVDTTGAGDAFAAAVLDHYARAVLGTAPPTALEVGQALRAGHALAAHACRRIGGRPPRG